MSFAACHTSAHSRLVIGKYYLLPSYTVDRPTFVTNDKNKFVYYICRTRNNFSTNSYVAPWNKGQWAQNCEIFINFSNSMNLPLKLGHEGAGWVVTFSRGTTYLNVPQATALHLYICISYQTDNHASTSLLNTTHITEAHIMTFMKIFTNNCVSSSKSRQIQGFSNWRVYATSFSTTFTQHILTSKYTLQWAHRDNCDYTSKRIQRFNFTDSNITQWVSELASDQLWQQQP